MERAYTYDSLGNMIQEEAEECLEFHYHGYTLYENRECCTRAEYNGVKRWDYTYDGRGNLTSIDKYQRTTQGMQLVNSEKYVYDETGKLVQGTNEDGEVSLYTYNGLGVRVGRELIVQDNTHGYTDFHKETPSVETGLSKPEVVKESYVVDYTRYTLDTLVKEESGGNTDRWLYGYQSLQVKITSEGTDWWGQQTSQNVLTAYTHHDRLGSIVNLTDQYGRNLVRADYREYGEIEFYETVTVNGGYRQIAPQLVYTNHEYDTVLELYYAKARFYDPADKRFLSMDPVKGSIIDPQSLVPYVYCVDNPLRWVDPLGMEMENYGFGNEDSGYELQELQTKTINGEKYASVDRLIELYGFHQTIVPNPTLTFEKEIKWHQNLITIQRQYRIRNSPFEFTGRTVIPSNGQEINLKINYLKRELTLTNSSFNNATTTIKFTRDSETGEYFVKVSCFSDAMDKVNYSKALINVVEKMESMRMSEEALSLLIKLEAPNDPERVRWDENGEITAIRNHEIGDGGITVGIGHFVSYNASSESLQYLNSLGVDGTDPTQWVPMSTIRTIFAEDANSHSQNVNNFAIRNNIVLTQQQYDAFAILAYNRPAWFAERGVADEIYLNNYDKEQFVEALMRAYKAGTTDEKYKRFNIGWRNRSIEEAEVYFDGEYIHNH